MLGPVRAELLALDPLRLTIDVWDPESDIPAPVPTPEGETPLHALSRSGSMPSTTARRSRRCSWPPRERLAGYSVVESLYRDYGGNQWSGPRDWPDGARSPGVLTVALLQQHPDLTFDEWMTRWHTRISPITEAIQPRMPLRPQRRVPARHRRSPATGRHRGGGVALPGARHRSDAVLLCGRRSRVA